MKKQILNKTEKEQLAISFMPNKLSQTEIDERINEILTRDVENIYPTKDLFEKALKSGKRLTVYIGLDPSSNELHLGHIGHFYKLKRFQKLGHKVIVLIGDFTGMIGDPTDKTAARVKLTREQVENNASTYKEQASKILDFDNSINPIEITYNSHWLSKMDFREILELTSEFTVQQMIERDMFQKRIQDNKPIYLHEFMYPLMQGWDSVAMNIDVELGGNDQIFNMLVGRDLVSRHLQKEKFVLVGKLLVDPSGKKISKTAGNMISLMDSPQVMFHKIMMWGDEIVPSALEMCTDLSMNEISKTEEKLKSKEMDGISGKKFLARTIVTELFSQNDAEDAEREYDSIAANSLDIEGIQEISVAENTSLMDLLVQAGLTNSKSDARRLIEQGAVRINDQTVSDLSHTLSSSKESLILQVGKRTKESYRKVNIKE